MRRIGKVAGGRPGKLKRDPVLRLMYRLALALGRTVAELRRDIDAEEFMHWRAFWGAEPWGDFRSDLHNVVLIKALLGDRTVRAEDLLVGGMEAVGGQRESTESMRAKARMYASMIGKWNA